MSLWICHAERQSRRNAQQTIWKSQMLFDVKDAITAALCSHFHLNMPLFCLDISSLTHYGACEWSALGLAQASRRCVGCSCVLELALSLLLRPFLVFFSFFLSLFLWGPQTDFSGAHYLLFSAPTALLRVFGHIFNTHMWGLVEVTGEWKWKQACPLSWPLSSDLL